MISPKKDFLFPVNESIGKGTGIGRLIPTCPASTSLWNFLAFDPDFVNIAAPLPYSFLKSKYFYILNYELIICKASSRLLALKTHMTGPKISSLYAVMSVVKSVKIEGPMKFPLS